MMMMMVVVSISPRHNDDPRPVRRIEAVMVMVMVVVMVIKLGHLDPVAPLRLGPGLVDRLQ